MRITGLSQSPMASVADQVIEAARQPLAATKARTEKVRAEKNEFASFTALVDNLGTSLGELRDTRSFRKLAATSSNPDILAATIDGNAEPGSYEFEIKDTARSSRQLSAGFASPETKVGFGFLSVSRPDMSDLDITVEPGSTLADVASKINHADQNLKASVINTGIGEEPFRLMVANAKTGELSRIQLDEDTTFLDISEYSPGNDLSLSYEDIDIKRATNSFNDLINGVTFNAGKAAPGTKVRIDVAHDIEATLGGIKAFADGYNKIVGYVAGQNQKSDVHAQNKPLLAGDSSLRNTMRQLQATLASTQNAGGGIGSLAEIGISTDPRSGQLRVDDNKLKQALSTNYEAVANLFAKTQSGDGIAERLAQTVRGLQDPSAGILKARSKTLDRKIADQDRAIEKQADRLAEKEASIRRQFNSLDAKMAAADAQQSALSARFGNTTGPAALMPKA